MVEILATYQYVLKNDGSEYSITYCENKDVCTKAIIPSEFNGVPVTSIYDSAFFMCPNLESLEIPSSVKSIGDSAFFCCSNLKDIKFENGCETIGDFAFNQCTSLTKVVLPDSLISIGFDAFAENHYLTQVEFGNKIQHIRRYAFWDTGLTKIILPDSLTELGEGAFSECTNLTEIMFMTKTPPSCGSCPFPLSHDFIIYCFQPVDMYKTATNLNDYAHYFVADDLRLHFTNSAIAQKKYFASKEELNNSDIESLNTQRAKVHFAPIESNDVVRLGDIVYASNQEIKNIIWG